MLKLLKMHKILLKIILNNFSNNNKMEHINDNNLFLNIYLFIR